MRIVCQKCSAAYAIDDKFVTPKGVRAQCPRCRHLQLVKKEEASAPAEPAPFLFDMAQPPPAAPPATASGPSGVHFGSTAPASGAAPSPFDFGTPPAAPEAPSAPAPFDFGGPPPAPAPFDFGAPPPPPAPAAPSPFDFGAPPAPPAPAASFDFGVPPPPPAPENSSPFDFSGVSGGELSAPAPHEGASGVKCSGCGKPLNDAFDQALGMCDECRNKSSESAPAPAAAPPPPVRLSAPPPPAPVAPPPAPVFPEPRSVQSATRQSGGGKGRAAVIAVAALALVGGAVFLAVKRPWVTKPPPLVVKPGPGAATPDSLISQWRLKYADLDRRAEDYAEEGDELLAKDTTSSYREAEESFEQALVLAPNDDRALAGWVLALAFGRGADLDEPTANAAEAMLSTAERRSGDQRLFIAHAHFLISRGGNPNDIKVLAERGTSSKDPHDQALAALAIGQTLLSKNPQQAADQFDKALKLDPKLKRAYLFQARQAVSQGHYRAAATALEKRLELDADQWEASDELARLLLDVGELARAKKVLEAAKAASPRAGRPRIALAVLAYQHQGDTAGAAVELNTIIDHPEQPPVVKAEALLHLATVQRMNGEADAALDSIDRSLELAVDSVAARLQKLLILIDKGVTSSARLELDSLKGKLGDKNLEDTLDGRLMIAEGRLDDALRTLSRVVEADPRRVDATFLAGAAAAKARKDGKAWEFCLKRGLRADPSSRPVQSLTPYFVRPADLLKPAVGAYQALVKNTDDDPSAPLCEGLVAWFSEDYTRADREFAKTIHIDPRNADAYAYRSLNALRKKDNASATSLASKAVTASKTNGNAYYAQAHALMAAKKPDLAKVAAQSAAKFSPQSLGAKVVLATVDASRGDADDARRVLTAVLLADNYYRAAKRSLYEHKL